MRDTKFKEYVLVFHTFHEDVCVVEGVCKVYNMFW